MVCGSTSRSGPPDDESAAAVLALQLGRCGGAAGPTSPSRAEHPRMPSRFTPWLESAATSRSWAMSRNEYRRPPPRRAARRHQAEPVVLAQGLGVQPADLGRDRDDVDRRLSVSSNARSSVSPLPLPRVVDEPGARVVACRRVAVGLERLAGRALDLERDATSTVTSRSPRCRPCGRRPCPDPEGPAVRGAGRDAQRDRVTRERRHADLGAERRLGERHRHRHVRWCPCARRRVWSDVHLDVEISVRGPAAHLESPCPSSGSGLAVRRPRGDPGRDRTAGRPTPRPLAGGARVVDEDAPALALTARSAKANPAPALRETCPVPWHVSHVCGHAPGRAPLPWQVAQDPSVVSRSGSSRPRPRRGTPA